MRQRAEDVEHRGDAELSPHRPGMTHRRVERPSEGKPDAVLGNLRFELGRGDIDRNTHCLEEVEAAGGRRSPTIAVFAHRRPGAGGDERAMVETLGLATRAPPTPTMSIVVSGTLSGSAAAIIAVAARSAPRPFHP